MFDRFFPDQYVASTYVIDGSARSTGGRESKGIICQTESNRIPMLSDLE